mmetsp:Transcript_71321/g.212731  ORF Transcript_71321/g.212731 Transcript_71321/m.212731 type:complete len:84 (-) Transcript_71321:154-405(-)
MWSELSSPGHVHDHELGRRGLSPTWMCTRSCLNEGRSGSRICPDLAWGDVIATSLHPDGRPGAAEAKYFIPGYDVEFQGEDHA